MWCFQTLKGGAENSTTPSKAKKGGNSGLLLLALQVNGRGVGCGTLGEARDNSGCINSSKWSLAGMLIKLL